MKFSGWGRETGGFPLSIGYGLPVLMSEAKGIDMKESWENKVVQIGRVVFDAAEIHPELLPLVTSWVNFAGKYGVAAPMESHEKQEFVIISKDDLAKLIEEIGALEYRIKTLES